MKEPRERTWVEILKAAGVELSFVEQDIHRLQRSQEWESEEAERKEVLFIPEDIRSVTGDEIELLSFYRGQGRTYLRCTTIYVRHGITTFQDGSIDISYSLPSSDERGSLSIIARDDDQRRCSSDILIEPDPGQLPLHDYGVCRRCSSRVVLGDLIDRRRSYTQPQFLDAIRTLLGRPFDRFVDPKDAPEHGCNREYSLWIVRQRARRRGILEDRYRREEALERENAESQEPSPSFVYLMKNNRSGYHKIGYSKHPEYRERTLQAEDPDVCLIWQVEGEPRDERHLHRKYRKQQIRGEWFDLNPIQVEWITTSESRKHLYRK